MLGRLKKSRERTNLFNKNELLESEDGYKLIRMTPASGELKLVGTFHTYEEAVSTIDLLKNDGLYYYVYGNSNRILYASEGQ